MTSRNTVLQRLAVEKLHGDECQAVLVVNFEDRADVGMVQSRGCFGFLLKTTQGLRVLSDLFRKELESYKTVKPGVLGFVDHTHATAAELLHNAVMRDGLSDQRNSALRVAILGMPIG